MSKKKKDKYHGNSKKNMKEQHLYKIEDEDIEFEDKTSKFGISGEELNKNGSSKRANKQVNKWNLAAGWERFKAYVLKIGILGRKKALKEEIKHVKDYVDKNKEQPPKQLRPIISTLRT